MNCLELRRIVTSEPDNRNLEITRHADQCVACNIFMEKQNRFDHLLTQAVMINSLEGLESRILHRHGMGEKIQARTNRTQWYSMAASIALVAVLSAGVFMKDKSQQTTPLEQLVVAHIQQEPQSFEQHNNVQLAALNFLFKPYSAHVNNNIGLVNYAVICQIRNTYGVHMVVQTDNGPVTVIYMPGEYVNSQETLDDGKYKGIIVPAGRGSIAIVSEDSEALQNVEDRIDTAISYDI